MGKKQVLDDLVDGLGDLLQFIHNTSADKINRFEEIGGLPMPSVAVTKQNIPF